MAPSLNADSPWTAAVRIGEIGAGLRRTLEADEATRARVARFLGLEALPALRAEVEVSPGGEGWRVRGRFDGRVTQLCGVTAEPFDQAVSGPFEVAVVAPEKAPAAPDGDPDEELGLDSIDPPDVAVDGVIDLAAYVVEHLALELDPFPRKPGAEFQPPRAEPEPSPFAALAALKRPE